MKLSFGSSASSIFQKLNSNKRLLISPVVIGVICSIVFIIALLLLDIKTTIFNYLIIGLLAAILSITSVCVFKLAEVDLKPQSDIAKNISEDVENNSIPVSKISGETSDSFIDDALNSIDSKIDNY